MTFKCTLEEDSPQKRQRLTGPPRHRESLMLRSRFYWQTREGQKSVTAVLLLDSGATGPVLSQQFVDNNQIPVGEKAERLLVEAATGENIGGGTHHKIPLDIHIGIHVSDIKFEVLNVPCGKKDIYVGFLPMSCLAQHNPDIDWAKGFMKWRSNYCKEHCLPKTIQIELINEEQLLRENLEDIHLFGMAVYHDEDGRDISTRLIDHYKDCAEVFSQEKIQTLPEHSEYDHKINIEPGKQPP
jgi:hypothetical protein